MMSLLDVIKDAEEKKVAVGHFNFSNISGLKAIVRAANSLSLPIIVGTSEGERDFVGIQEAVALVRAMRTKYKQPIFLNADHTYSVEKIKVAVEAGYDSVIYDGAKLPLDENIKKAKEAVDVAKGINPDIVVEGELGYIGTSSSMLDEIPEGANTTEDSFTTPEDARRFVIETGVDLFAPSVGNLHGMLKHTKNPKLSINLIRNIREAAGVPLVLHGGSGITDSDFQDGIRAGISVVHINTEIRVASRDALEKTLNEKKDEIAPYKLMADSELAMEKVISERLKLFNFLK